MYIKGFLPCEKNLKSCLPPLFAHIPNKTLKQQERNPAVWRVDTNRRFRTVINLQVILIFTDIYLKCTEYDTN